MKTCMHIFVLQMSQQAMLDSLDKELKESEFNSKWIIIIFDFFNFI